MPTPPISDKELERYRECLQRKINEGYAPLGRRSHLGSALESAADELRANSGSLYKLIRRGRIKLDTANWEPPDRALDVPQPPRQSDDLERALDRERRRLETERVTEARVWREIHRLSEPTPEPPDWTIRGHLGGSSPGLPVTIWSDWHWGETINPDEVGGVNSFDIPTAHERVRRLIERTIDVCQHHMVTPDYPGIVVCLGGDMITGEIHPELAATNDADLMPTLVDLESTQCDDYEASWLQWQ